MSNLVSKSENYIQAKNTLYISLAHTHTARSFYGGLGHAKVGGADGALSGGRIKVLIIGDNLNLIADL